MVVFRFYQLTNLLTIPIFPTVTPNNGVAQIINSTAVQPSKLFFMANLQLQYASADADFSLRDATLIYDLAAYARAGGQQAVGISTSDGREAVGPSYPEIMAGSGSAGYFFALSTSNGFTVELDGYGAPGEGDGVTGQ